MIKLDFSQFNAEGFTKAIEKHVKQVTEALALKTFNYIVLSEMPVWSGSYSSSWNIGVGSIDTSYNSPPEFTGKRPATPLWDTPSPIASISSLRPYQSVYISNATPHSELVENRGTGSNLYTPWKIAYHAFNSTTKTKLYF